MFPLKRIKVCSTYFLNYSFYISLIYVLSYLYVIFMFFYNLKYHNCLLQISKICKYILYCIILQYYLIACAIFRQSDLMCPIHEYQKCNMLICINKGMILEYK